MVSERLLLIDTDVLVLLSASGTLEAAIQMLGFDLANARRLPAAISQLERGSRFREDYPATALRTALRQARRIQPVTTIPEHAANLDLLSAVSGIDYGEAQLFAMLAENPSHLLTTGDKRGLIALACDPSLATLRSRVAGRVICLETVLRLLVDADGAASIGEPLTAAAPQHKTLQVVFSPVNMTDTARCLAALDTYIADLEQQVRSDFLYKP